MTDEKPISSEEMIRRAREDLMKETPPIRERVASRPVRELESDAESVLERADSKRPAPPVRARRDAELPPPPRPRPPPPPGTPRRRMPGPVATPPTVPSRGGPKSRRGIPWLAVLPLLFFVGSLISARDDSSPSVDTILTTPAPAPTLGEVFRDQFDGSLGSGWTWVNEVPGDWDLADRPGWLRLVAPPSGEQTSTIPPNLLLRRPADDTYEITTHLEFSPTSNFQAAGLIVFDNALNYVQLVRAFCGNCVGDDGVYLDTVRNGRLPESDGGHPVAGRVAGVYLRMRVEGNQISASYSVDGATWQSAGTTTKALITPRIGIVAWPNDPAPPEAYFDFFEVLP